MSFAQERTNIEGRFAQMWAATSPVAYEDVPFTAPANAGKYVRLTIRNGAATNQDIGGPDGSTIRKKLIGRIWVQCFQPENTGSADARGLADAAAAIFENARFNGIRCYAAELTTVGPDGNGYFQINLSIPYTRFQ